MKRSTITATLMLLLAGGAAMAQNPNCPRPNCPNPNCPNPGQNCPRKAQCPRGASNAAKRGPAAMNFHRGTNPPAAPAAQEGRK